MKTDINHIGSFAQQALDRSESALVSGIASRGIYLQPERDWTLYISRENFRGPLTLNLKEGSARLEKIMAGDTVLFQPGEIQFPDSKITISLKDGKIWHPPEADKKIKSLPENLDHLFTLTNKIIPDNPYLPLLSGNPDQIPGVPVIGERILNLQNALKIGDPEEVAEGAIKILGLGPGLTPLGDDFLLGVVLTINRWKHIFSPSLLDQGQRFSEDQAANIAISLNQVIRENTPVKTTRISASLQDCAMEGAADERLLVVLDGLFSGSSITQGELRNLLRWGNSSGVTVLAGMISALKTKDAES